MSFGRTLLCAQCSCSNTCPQTKAPISIASLSRMDYSWFLGSALVKTFASYHNAWYWWKPGTKALCLAAWLSQCIEVGLDNWKQSSMSSINDVTSQTVWMMALYSTLALELTTNSSFFLFQDTRLHPPKLY